MRIVFMGTPGFARRSLQALLDARLPVVGVVTQPARPAGRGRLAAQPPVGDLALEMGLPLIQPANPHVPESMETIRGWNPDVVVVVAYGHILRPALLQAPRRGCLNLHASLLPRHRGACPIPAAILAGDRVTGVTVMLLDAGMDSGPILAQRHLTIAGDDTTGSLTTRLADLGAGLLVETVPAWLAGEIEHHPQDESQATYTGMLSKSDGWLDWSQPATVLWRQVRALDPWPGTFSSFGGKNLKVLSARPVEPVGGTDGRPGDVVSTADGPAVITGEGWLLLVRLQLAGKAPTEGVSFARGQRGFLGACLGR